MAWVKGFDFRATSGYVTDPTDYTYVLGSSDAYPTTRNSVTFGWTVNPGGGTRDRSTAVARVAGINFGSGAGTFRVDLPATGSYDVGLAMGDASSAQTATKVLIKDNTTTLITVGPHNVGINQFYDANDTSHATGAAWNSSNTPKTVTFGSTILNLTLETATTNSVIACLYISQNAATAKLFRNSNVDGIGAGGPFFSDPLSAQPYVRRDRIFVPAHVAGGSRVECAL